MILNKSAKYSSNLRNNKKKNDFSVTPVGVYSQPRAQLLLSHICIFFVLASLSIMDFLLFYYIFNCSVDMNNFVVYQHFIFSKFNRSWMFLKHFLPIVITLQVLHVIFKATLSLSEWNCSPIPVPSHLALTPSPPLLLKTS